jgi:hypothetical protein
MPHIVNNPGLEAFVSSRRLNALTVMNRHKSATKGGLCCACAVVVSGRGFHQDVGERPRRIFEFALYRVEDSCEHLP